MTKYQTTIGLEIHVQLKTKSKMFCGCDNVADEAAPNTLVCPVCLGSPGVLPVANAQAIKMTIKTGLALGGEIPERAKFDRKHYFYPDLPKGYQISQYDQPFVIGGQMELSLPAGKTGIKNKELRIINLTRIHLEEDAGKLIHQDGESLVDLNRAGTPLMEIVTEPELHSPQEAKLFMQNLRSVLRYLSVSDANMEKGHLRCDANISIAKCQMPNDKCQTLGTPVEIKNLNSFRMVERALLYEEQRQQKILDQGGKITKETRGWDDNKGITTPQRSKEIAADYRYFPEPDLPPFEVKKLFDIEKIRAELPDLPDKKRNKIISELKNEKDYNPSVHDAAVDFLIKEPILYDYYDYFSSKGLDKLLALMFVTHQMWGKLATGTKPEQFNKDIIFEIVKQYGDKKINNIKTKEIFELSLVNPEKVSETLKNSEISIVGDELNTLIEQILNDNPKPVADFKTGKSAALGFLVGEVMRQTRGQANPEIVNKIIKERLDERS